MLRERLNQLALIGAAVVFAWVGLVGLFAPMTIAAPIAMALQASSAVNEVRANYGGMHLGMAALFVVGAVSKPFRRCATVVLTVFTGGLVLGRLVSIVVDGLPNRFVFQLLVAETAGAVAGATLWLAPRSDAPSS